MKKTAIYPGSFNPWHQGHSDVLAKALKVFDQVIIVVCINPAKEQEPISKRVISVEHAIEKQFGVGPLYDTVEVHDHTGFIVDYIKAVDWPIHAVVKGLRDGNDLEDERVQQYWNEDLGIPVPTVYFLTDRKLIHISSSAIRAVEKMKEQK